MSNSIIDQQKDNEDFQFRRSVYNGKTFMRHFLTGEMPEKFYDDLGPKVKPIGINGPFKKMPLQYNS